MGRRKEGWQFITTPLEDYFFFTAAFLAGTFLTTFAALSAFSTSDVSGRRPNAESFGFNALSATGTIAPSNEYASVAGSVTPDAYIATAAAIADRPYEDSIALICFVFILILLGCYSY